MNKISSAIKCSNCIKILLRPVTLPCGHSICKAHIEQIADGKIVCHNCDQQHSNCGSLAVNEALSQLVAQFSLLDFGETHTEAKQSCDDLSDVIAQIDVLLKDPYFYIHEFIGEFRRRVDLKHEEYKLKLEQETQRILAQLDNLEAECKKKLKISNDLRTVKEEAQKQLDEYLCALNELKFDEKKWKDIKTRCQEKVDCLKEKFSKVKSYLFELEPNIGHVEFHIQMDIDPLREFRRFTCKMDSKILNAEQKMKFVKLCEFASNTKFELFYRGTRDGFGPQHFHTKCDNKPKTVTIIKSTNNNIFGGYTETSWNSSSNAHARDPNAFLISLINQHDQPIKMKIDPSLSQYAIYNGPYCPVFGAGNDILIANDCNLNTNSSSNLGHTYKHSIYENDSTKAKSFLAGSPNFQVAEIEVFQLN